MDEQIIFKHIRANDLQAFTGLFEDYYQILCQFAYSMCQSEEISEEIVSDFFLTIWLKRDKLSIPDNVKAYLYKGTRNQYLMYLRKNHKVFYSIEKTSKTPVSLLSSPEDQLHLEDTSKVIEHVLASFPENTRSAFLLHKEQGFKYEQVAQILDISISAVEKHLMKALAGLKKALSIYQ